MKRLASLLRAAAILALALGALPAAASPAGATYVAGFSADVIGGTDPNAFGTEFYDANAPFDGAPSAMSASLDVIGGDVGDFLPLRDAWVVEFVTPTGSLSEIVEILIFGGDGTSTPPAAGSHGVLVANPLDVFGFDPFLSVSGLFWADAPVSISPALSVSYDGGSTFGAFPGVFALDPFGAGTDADPFGVDAEFPVAAFGTPTDLRLQIEVVLVPEPSAALLAALALGALAALRARR